MSSVLEPSFLLELGAYAVAFAGIRLFKNRYLRAGTQPSDEGNPNDDQTAAPVLAAPVTVLGLGQASPLRAPASPRRSSSASLQTEAQLATSVAPQLLHGGDSAATPSSTFCYSSPSKRASSAAASGSATGTVEEIAAEASASEALGAELSAHATAVEAEKWGLDATTVYPKADDGAVLDVLIQPADQATHASIPCGRISHENMEDPMDDDTIPRTEWLLLLRHCAECHPPDEEWNFARSRAVVLHLWKHILRCSDARCKYPRASPVLPEEFILSIPKWSIVVTFLAITQHNIIGTRPGATPQMLTFDLTKQTLLGQSIIGHPECVSAREQLKLHQKVVYAKSISCSTCVPVKQHPQQQRLAAQQSLQRETVERQQETVERQQETVERQQETVARQRQQEQPDRMSPQWEPLLKDGMLGSHHESPSTAPLIPWGFGQTQLAKDIAEQPTLDDRIQEECSSGPSAAGPLAEAEEDGDHASADMVDEITEPGAVQDVAAVTWTGISTHDRRPAGGNRHSGLVSQLAPAPHVPADKDGIQSVPPSTAASEQNRQAASNTMTTFSEGGPSFKFFCVGDGGSVKVCGAELVASAQRSAAGVSNLTSSAEPAENRSHDRVEADEQVQKEAGKVSMLWDCLCGDTSQSISQDESPQTLDLHASSGRGAQRDSSAAGLVMDGSGGDGELQPAEEAVATHRDILLRAAQRRKRGSTDSDSFVSHPSLNFMTHSRKKLCGSHTAGDADAGRTEVTPASSAKTSCTPGESRAESRTFVLRPASISLGVATTRGKQAGQGRMQPTAWGGCRKSTWCRRHDRHRGLCNSRAKRTYLNLAFIHGNEADVGGPQPQLVAASSPAPVEEQVELNDSNPGSNEASHQLLAELPMVSTLPEVRQPNPPSIDVALPGVDQDPNRGLASSPASSDCQPQLAEEEEGQFPVSSRATAPRPERFLPIAGSVFDDSPTPLTAAVFDDTMPIHDTLPIDDIMYENSPMHYAEEDEVHRQATPEQPEEATADHVSQPADDSLPAAVDGGEEEEQVDVHGSLDDSTAAKSAAEETEYSQVPHEQPTHTTELEPMAESAAEAASGSNRLYQDEGRYWRLRARLYQPHCHESDSLSNGCDHAPSAKPSADSAHPGERLHSHQPGTGTKDQCTWEPMDHAKHGSSESHAHHDSSEQHAQLDGPQETDWACVLPRVDSAPPVTPDSPNHSSEPPESPSWGVCGDAAWDSPPRAAPDSPRQSAWSDAAWDSSPWAAPNSPALAYPRAHNSRPRRTRTPPRAMSSSPVPRATSVYEAAWHSPPRLPQASTPMPLGFGVDPLPPPSEGHPYEGDVVGGLDGDYAFGSCVYPPPPPTPTSPSPPPSSPPHHSGPLPYRWRSWRRRTLASRAPATESPQRFPASHESPPHHEEPGRAAPDSPALVDDTQPQGEEEQQGQKAAALPLPLPYSHMGAFHEGAATIPADKPPQHDSSPAAEEEGASLATQETQGGEADQAGLKTGEWEEEVLPLLPLPPSTTGEGQAVQGIDGEERRRHMAVSAAYGLVSQVSNELEESLGGAAAASSPEPVPDIRQADEEEEPTDEPSATREGHKQGRADFLLPQPSPQAPSQSSPQPASESAFGDSPQDMPRVQDLEEESGSPPSSPSRSQSPKASPAMQRALARPCSCTHRHNVYKSESGTPVLSDKEERAADADDSPSGSRDKSGGVVTMVQGGSNMGKVLQQLEKILPDYCPHQGSAAATSPEPVNLLQAKEEEQGDRPTTTGQGQQQDRAAAASGPLSKEPEMMLEDEEVEECYDDEVQLVSETGPDPSRSAFASAVKRLAEARASPEGHWPSLADEEEEIELYPGVQDIISRALDSNHDRFNDPSGLQARHSRRSMVADDNDLGTDKSTGRGPLRRKRGYPTSPESRRSSPSKRGRKGFGKRYGEHGHTHDRLFCEEEDTPWGRPASTSASVSAAAGSHEAGAAGSAPGSHARRLRDALSVAEEEEEEDHMDADMTCWRRLLKKPQHH